ncbi:hypothetical protein IQ37_17875 [Chryseobacterium piperi]|uniref:Uncharacterized protein n=2 Tax=Chryseobacterium piperi TaxID=558152 RepID=A0A086AHN2_9FLAO|nr:hypothetical protein CJF12_05995 [Chryseobacterium piperi]KFF16196.1 hypothetical protein IQ37_17875 [Chryseobacterium piperi]
MKEKFNHLLGKTRHEITQEIGDGFNYFKSDIWTYELGRTWIGKRIILSIKFKDKKASEISISKSFRKC